MSASPAKQNWRWRKVYRMRASTCWISACPAPKKSISPRSISAWMAALKLPPAITDGLQRHEAGARGSPISGDTGLRDVQRLAEANDFPPVDETKRGRYQPNQSA